MNNTQNLPSFGGQGSVPAEATDSPKKRKKRQRGGLNPGRRNAILAAGLAALVFAAVASTGSSEPTTTWVLRTRVDVNALEQVREGMLEAVELPPEAVLPDAISGDSAEEVLEAAAGDSDGFGVVGAYPVYPIRQGQQLSLSLFSSDGRVDLSLAPDERLVSVSASATAAVAGALQPGDRVDVVAVNGPDRSAGVVAADLEIVSVQVAASQLSNVAARQASEDGRELSPEDLLPRDPIPGIYVVRADVKTAAALAVADTTSPLYLLYRGPGAETPDVGIVGLNDVLCADSIAEGCSVSDSPDVVTSVVVTSES